MSRIEPLAGPLAVVTGASSGIGVALARVLAGRGFVPMLVARRGDRLKRLATEIRDAHGVDAEIRECDLADRADRGHLAEELAAREVTVLCNNAGFPGCEPVVAADPRREAAQVEVNTVALHQLTLAVLPGMLARRAGAILVTGSTAGEQPVPTAATYAATKAFANVFAESLHGELRGTGVTCTLLAPGPVRTEFAQVGGIPGAERVRWFGWLSAERVADEAVRAMARGQRVVVPGPMAKLQAFAGRHSPRAVLFLLRGVILPRLRTRERHTS
jgi:short-subunit dehydrogenase